MAGLFNDQNKRGDAGRRRKRAGLPGAVLIILLTAVALFLFRSFSPGPSLDIEKKSVSVSVGINNSLKSAPLVIAEKTGGFRQHGIDATLVMEPTAAPLLKRMTAGELDIVCAPELLVALLALERDDFRILAVLNRNQSHELIINTAAGIDSALGLKGRRIGLKMDSGALYFLYRKLLYHDVALTEVELIDVEPEMMPDKLAAGEIDAAIAWPPFTDRIRQRLGASALVANAHIGRDMYWLLVAREEWCRKNSKVTEAFLAALQDAFHQMDAFPEEAMAMAGDYFGFPADLVRREWPVYHFELELPQSLLFAMEQMVEWQQARTGTVVARPDFFRLVEYRPLKKLFPDKVTIIH